MIPMAPPGHEGVGYVSRVGADVAGFKEGDRVAGGGFATVRNLSSERIYPIPNSELADEYWIVEPVACVVTGIDHTNLRAGETVALIGCGFMGQLLLQGLLHSPVGRLIAIDIVEDRLQLARRQGARETINLAEHDRDDLAAALKARNIDVVVDASGSQPGLDLATDIVKTGGRINLFGWIKGQQARFDPTKWHTGGLTVVNSSPASKTRNTFPPAIELIDAGVFEPAPVGDTYDRTGRLPVADGGDSGGREVLCKGCDYAGLGAARASPSWRSPTLGKSGRGDRLPRLLKNRSKMGQMQVDCRQNRTAARLILVNEDAACAAAVNCLHHTVSIILSPSYCLHHTVSIILSPSYCLHHTVSIILSPSYCLHHTVSIILTPSY